MVRLHAAFALVCLMAGFTFADNVSGDAKFTGPNKEVVKVAAGETLKLNVQFKQIDIVGQSAVTVSGSVKNPTATRMFYSYNVAFLDKDKNLIGCQNFALDVQAGKDAPVGTFIFLPRQDIARIQYYSVAFYEGTNPIGK